MYLSPYEGHSHSNKYELIFPFSDVRKLRTYDNNINYDENKYFARYGWLLLSSSTRHFTHQEIRIFFTLIYLIISISKSVICYKIAVANHN